MMRNKIKQLVDERGITPYRFHSLTGISLKTAYDLYNKPEQYPSGDVMDKICRWANVQPNDVIEYIEGSLDKNGQNSE